MNQSKQLLTLQQRWEEAIAQAMSLLSRADLDVLRSFDLRSVRAVRSTCWCPDLSNCTCPHHGTSLCDCQFVVFLIYGHASEPAVLLVYGHGGQTWFCLVNSPEQYPDPKLEETIVRALAPAQFARLKHEPGLSQVVAADAA